MIKTILYLKLLKQESWPSRNMFIKTVAEMRVLEKKMLNIVLSCAPRTKSEALEE